MDIPGNCGKMFKFYSEVNHCINRYNGMKNYTLINQYKSEIDANIT